MILKCLTYCYAHPPVASPEIRKRGSTLLIQQLTLGLEGKGLPS